MRYVSILCIVLLCLGFASSSDTKVFEFQAEVSRLMDIIINSLYSNKDIFLRELISNASDALDKLRFLALTDKSALGEGDDANLEIRVSFDKENNTLTIHDRGIGMSEEDLISNLGTVARSGTTKFLEAAQSGIDALSLIGQFGVGFYSAFLVADEVVVRSKRSGEKQYVWVSDAEKTFQVYEDPAGNTLGHHGTSITLKMKPDAESYLDQSFLEDIIERYSEFIDFPIYLYTSETVTKEVPVLEMSDEEAGENEDDAGDDDDDDDDDVADEEKPKTETVEEQVFSWKKINENKPLWTRSKAEITDDEYRAFFHTLAKDKSDPLVWNHFKAEGGVDFTALLYIPDTAPHDLYDKYYEKQSSMKLYVRRVLIADQFEDFMPRYLNFIRGVVDSDDLPINVSRETLQKSKVLQIIGRRLTRKVLKMLEDLADKKVDDAEEDPEASVEDGPTYMDFWKNYGKSIKLGILEDNKNKNKLMKLLRFESSKSDGELIGLDEYVSNMKEDQKHIYFISGDSVENVKTSPMLERLVSKDLEVLFFVDSLDEYIVSSSLDYDGYKLMSVSKEKLDLGDEEEEITEETKESFSDFCDFLKETLKGSVGKVKVSNRMSSSPAIVVTGQHGWSANMERIMKNQNMGNEMAKLMSSSKILEINPTNDIVLALKSQFESDKTSPVLHDNVKLLFDAAMLSSGFTHDEPMPLVERLHRALGASLSLDVSYPEVPAATKEPEAVEDHDEL